MNTLQLVKGCPLFYELYDEEIMKIVKNSRVLNLKREYIFKDKDEGDEIFLILNGSVEVQKKGCAIVKLVRGDLFGEMVLLKDNVRHSDVYIENFADILVIKYEELFKYFSANNQVFSILMLNLARMLATRLKKTGMTIEKLIIENKELKSR